MGSDEQPQPAPPLADDAALMTAEQLATYLQTHVNTVLKFARTATIPVAAWIGKCPRFHRPSVLAALSRRHTPQSVAAPTPTPEAPHGLPEIRVRRRRFGKRSQEHA